MIYKEEVSGSKEADLAAQLKAVKTRLDYMEHKLTELDKTYCSCKRRRVEDDNSKTKNKIGIFIHVVGNSYGLDDDEIASRLYKLEIDSDLYYNPYPSSVMSFRHGFNQVQCISSPQKIKPVFTFGHGFPLGMACVLFGSNHTLYFMGGTKSLLTRHEAADPSMYPRRVYVFDCFTCKLLSSLDSLSPPPMNSGKSADPFTFVQDGKLYVLSSSTQLPNELHMFEFYDPRLRTWKILNDFPCDDWRTLHKPLGSVLINGVFFVSYTEEHGSPHSPVHIFSYQVSKNKWNKTLSVYTTNALNRGISVVPSFERDSVFVKNKFYSSNISPLFENSKFQFPVLSYGPIPATSKLDAYALKTLATPNLTPIFPLDACWPIYYQDLVDEHCVFGARLVHLGGLLDGTKADTKCFGFVKVSDPDDISCCYIRFVAFEACDDEITCDSDTYKDAADSNYKLPDECGPFFKAETLHTSHFYSPGFASSRLNAVCALVLP